MEVALDPATLLVCGRDDPRARGFDLGQLAAQLDAQSRDLDRQPPGLDDPAQQGGVFLARELVEHDAERLAAALDREPPPPVVGKVGDG